MHIVIVEGDWQERKGLIEELRQAFPLSNIIEFKTIGDFISVFDTLLSTVDIVISEYVLPLASWKNEKAWEEWLKNFKSLFPEIMTEFKSDKAGEILVNHIRKKNINIPVIIYTNSPRKRISSDILQDPKVTYCQKSLEGESIVPCIRQLLSI